MFLTPLRVPKHTTTANPINPKIHDKTLIRRLTFLRDVFER